jgi:serine/threonine-protein kinase
LLRLLGVGGASAVYEAMHRNGRRAAVKVLSHLNLRDLATCKLAAQEAVLANLVAHPGVVEVLDDDIAEDGTAYLVMELLDGATLETRRRDAGGRLDLDAALPIFEQLLDVLAVAHDRGIVHRDLKPDNVFVTSTGRVKVLDFGLAAAGRQDDDPSSPWFGTPGFMPPEQARAAWSEVDVLSDQWAAAATFATVLSGRFVHEGRTPTSLVRAALSEDVDLSSLSSLEGVPMRVLDVLQRALASDKADRWPTTRAFLTALRAAASSEVRPMSPPRRRSEVVPSMPTCRSRTRMFLMKGSSPRTSCGRPGDTGECSLTCTLCPVCPTAATIRVV